VDAVSALVTPLQMLPPSVPMLRSCGPPAVIRRLAEHGHILLKSGLFVAWEKLVIGPMRSAPSGVHRNLTQLVELVDDHELRAREFALAHFNHTSLPPAISVAFGWSAQKHHRVLNAGRFV
jgi:hypothetical protein